MWLEEQVTRSGETLSSRQVVGLLRKRSNLTKAFPAAEQAFCKIVEGIKRDMAPETRGLIKYQRQKLISVTAEFSFFADFYFRAFKTVVEIDGSSHRGRLAIEKDAIRTKLIQGNGTRICRFWNEEVEGDPQAVRDRLIAFLAADSGRRKIKQRFIESFR